MAFTERQTDRHTEVRATGVHNNEPHRLKQKQTQLNWSRHKSRAGIIYPQSGLQGYFWTSVDEVGANFLCHWNDMAGMAESKPDRKWLSEKGGNFKKLLKMLYFSSVLLPQYVFFWKKSRGEIEKLLEGDNRNCEKQGWKRISNTIHNHFPNLWQTAGQRPSSKIFQE